MAGYKNPAFAAFVAEITDQFILAQVCIQRKARGFELRHVADAALPSEDLRKVSRAELRSICDFTLNGQFRPLKSAPNLRDGWVHLAEDEASLEDALNQLYPNAIADRFAVKSGHPPITNYREFTRRQTGMYRITAMLDDSQAAHVVRSCCDRKFCLKQRLWTVGDLGTDPAREKSGIPCLEPCAILLEFARKGMRIEQEEKISMTLSPSDISSLKAALSIALGQPSPQQVREADFNLPENPRRLQLALDKINSPGINLANTSEGE